MALTLAKPTLFGVSASYWRVIGLTIDYRRKVAHFALEGFVDKAAAEAGHKPIVDNVRQTIKGDMFIKRFGTEDARSSDYAFLKEFSPDWAQAVDS